MQDFKDLIVWKKAHENALMIYNLTKLFPKDELYGITSQLRRGSVSVPTNIAEGCGKFTQKDLRISYKSHWVPAMRLSI